MSTTYYQVVGRSPCMIDYPTGDAIAHRPGAVFEADATNGSVLRAVRAGRLREMSNREATALRNVEIVAAKTKAAALKNAPVEPAKPADSIKLNKPKAQ
jgi:hypothetical protein